MKHTITQLFSSIAALLRRWLGLSNSLQLEDFSYYMSSLSTDTMFSQLLGSSTISQFIYRVPSTPLTFPQTQIFSLNSNLQSLVLIGEATIIEESAFKNCSALQQISFPICDSINRDAFMNCQNLKTVSIPDCNFIGGGAFRSCISLSKILLNGSFGIQGAQITPYAFENCTTLHTLYITKPTFFQANALYGCSNLQSIYLTYSKSFPIDVQTQAPCKFNEYRLASNFSGSIFVPASTISIYLTDSTCTWSMYSSQFAAIEDYPPPASLFD